MYSRRDVLRSAALASGSLPLLSTAIFAQADYPSREIRAICPYPPGTGVDITIRAYCRKLQDVAGKPVVVENRAGAFGNIATEYVAKSKPDGYTIFIVPGSAMLAAAPNMFHKLNFDPINDFEHITTLAKQPFILFVAADSPYKTVADLVVDLRKRGDKGNYGSIAHGGIVASELLKVNFGLSTVEVKYKEPSALFNDLLGGSIAFTYTGIGSAAALLEAGKVRAIATTSRDKFEANPTVPSATEAGITNTDLISWWSVHVPKGTPKPILDRLEVWFNRIAVDEDIKKFLFGIGIVPMPGTPQSLKELLVKETKAWSEYVKLAKIEPLG